MPRASSFVSDLVEPSDCSADVYPELPSPPNVFFLYSCRYLTLSESRAYQTMKSATVESRLLLAPAVFAKVIVDM